MRAKPSAPIARYVSRPSLWIAARSGAGTSARVDVSEINTIPGFTPISLFPTMPAEGGYTFTSVCERIVELALERAAGQVAGTLVAADLPR